MISATIDSRPAGRLSTVTSIAHDLRNPLATIHCGAEMLFRSILSQTQVHCIARNMYCASVRMRELLGNSSIRTEVPKKRPNSATFASWSPRRWTRLRSPRNCRLCASFASCPKGCHSSWTGSAFAACW